MPEEQQVLFEKIVERTSNIVTVVIAGRPLDLRRISERSKAVIMAWRPGTMGAEAIIDIVYGRINPSGKLSVSIPWCVGQVPISYWDVKTGHILTEDNSENRFTSRYMAVSYTHLIALKAVMTIAGFAFNAIRKGFTYCSRNVRRDISTSLYSLPAFTAP